jgi:hypothetical protein
VLAGLDVDYVAVAEFDGQPTLVIAARVGRTRLIDNAPLVPLVIGAFVMMKLSLADLIALKQQHQRITMVTAYDAPSARFSDAAGIDAILVGDSAAMTVFGYDQTKGITLDDMLLLARAARRGASRALLIADMPFASVPVSDEGTVANAVRIVKEQGRRGKVEGADRCFAASAPSSMLEWPDTAVG